MKINLFDKLPSLSAITVAASVVTPYVNRNLITHPFLMTVVVTHRCNSRCIMCNLWEEKKSPMLSLDDYSYIFRKPFPFIRGLTLTGGEPTLRSDLPEIFEIVSSACTNLEHVQVASHGMNTERTLEMVELIARNIALHKPKIRHFSVQISLDGLGEAHERVRRIPNSFEKICKTLDGIQDLAQYYPMLDAKLSCVVMPQNLDQVEPLRSFAAQRGLQIYFSPAVISGTYYRNLQDTSAIGFVSGQELNGEAKEVFANLAEVEKSNLNFYYSDMVSMLDGETRQRKCMQGFFAFILEHTGDIYPCVNWEQQSFGNLLTQDFDDIWFGERAYIARQALHETGCPSCPALCYTLPVNPKELFISTLNRL